MIVIRYRIRALNVFLVEENTDISDYPVLSVVPKFNITSAIVRYIVDSYAVISMRFGPFCYFSCTCEIFMQVSSCLCLRVYYTGFTLPLQ